MTKKPMLEIGDLVFQTFHPWGMDRNGEYIIFEVIEVRKTKSPISKIDYFITVKDTTNSNTEITRWEYDRNTFLKLETIRKLKINSIFTKNLDN